MAIGGAFTELIFTYVESAHMYIYISTRLSRSNNNVNGLSAYV